MLKRIIRISLMLIMVLFSNCLVYAATTQVDITNLGTGADVSHTHVYTDKYNSTHHWQECLICNYVRNKVAHTMNTGNWVSSTMKKCHPANYRLDYCNCGYTSQYRESHVKPASGYNYYSNLFYIHGNYCLNGCGQVPWTEGCVKADGTAIKCTNPGQCAKCGNSYYEYHYGGRIISRSSDGKTRVVGCSYCSATLFEATEEEWTLNLSNFTGRLKVRIKYYDTTQVLTGPWTEQASGFGVRSSTITNEYLGPGEYRVTDDMVFDSTAQSPFIIDIVMSVAKYLAGSDSYRVQLDQVAPYNINVTSTDISTSNGWCLNKQLTVTGNESYSDMVYVSLLDANKNTLFSEKAVAVSGGSFSTSFNPNIEAATPTTFYVRVRDRMGNYTDKAVVYEKIDRKSPTLKSASSYLSPWRKNQVVTFQFEDKGIGAVKVSFGNTNDYQDATYNSSTGYYERQYNFYGNVPNKVIGAVYAKDGIGNEIMYQVSFNLLDNTNPTISASNKTYGEDITATIGDTHAGVTGHQITSSNSQPSTWIADSSESSKTVNFGIKNAGTWYLWVKDGAGNVNSTSMSVGKRSITITASDQTTYHPTRITKTAAYATSNYLVSGQSITAITLTDNPGGTSFPTPNANGVGTGTITPSAATITSPTDGNVTGNYTITYANGTWTVKDNTKPTGRIKITNPVILRDGRQAVGNSATNVTITATDNYAKVKEIYLFNENNITTPVGNIPASSWINWETSTSLTNVGTNTKTMNWTLSNGDGAKTVYLYIKDRAGNVSVTF